MRVCCGWVCTACIEYPHLTRLLQSVMAGGPEVEAAASFTKLTPGKFRPMRADYAADTAFAATSVAPKPRTGFWSRMGEYIFGV